MILTAVNGYVTPVANLPDAAADAAVAALAEVIGDAAQQTAWRRRLARNEGNGSWVIGVRRPAVPLSELREEDRDQPWRDWRTNVFEAEIVYYPLAAGVAAVRDPNGTDAEVERRLRLRREYEAHQATERAAREQAEREGKESEQRERKRSESLGKAEWDALPPHVMALYALAVRVKGRDPELAADMRAVAASCSKYTRFEVPLPDEEWRR